MTGTPSGTPDHAPASAMWRHRAHHQRRSAMLPLEHVSHNAGVGGSSPPPATRENETRTPKLTGCGTPTGTHEDRNARLVERIRGQLRYDAATGELFWRTARSNVSAGSRAGCVNSHNGYEVVRIDGRLYPKHRVIWMLVHGVIPQGLVIDHINRQRGDNRLENLRLVTRSVNMCNTDRADSAVGVYFTGTAWRADIRVHGKRVSKCFSTRAEAVAFRDAKARERAA